MLFGEKVTIGPLMNEDALPLFCWFNDPAAARDDYSYRPVDQATHAAWWENVGRDTSKVVFAIRRIGETRMLGYVHLINIDTVHRAAEMLGTTPAFLRAIGEARLITPLRSEGGHRRYSRYQLRIAARARELVDQGTTIEAACRIIILEDQLEEALRINEQLRRSATEPSPEGGT